MTERRIQNDLGSDNGDLAMFVEPKPEEMRAVHERSVAHVRLLWERRRFLLRWTIIGLVMSLVAASLIPSRYVATTKLMPPDNQSSAGAGSFLSAA